MAGEPLKSPLTREALLDEYFIENRTRLLDLAAFLDRLDRIGAPAAADFRLEAFAEALSALCMPLPSRVKKIQMIFSDPTTEPLETFDRKSAGGAYDPERMERR